MFGATVRQARKKAKLTQRDLALLLEVDPTYISKIENEKTEVLPSAALLYKLETELNLNNGDLLHLSGKIDSKQLQRIAMNNPIAAKCLRKIQSGTVTEQQWLKICEVLGT